MSSEAVWPWRQILWKADTWKADAERGDLFSTHSVNSVSIAWRVELGVFSKMSSLFSIANPLEFVNEKLGMEVLDGRKN